MIKGSIHQEDVTIINTHALNVRTQKLYKANITRSEKRAR